MYLYVALAFGFVFGRTQTDRESVLGLRRPSERAMLLGAAAWLGAYVGAAALYLGAAALGASLTPVLTSCSASALTEGDWQTHRRRLSR